MKGTMTAHKSERGKFAFPSVSVTLKFPGFTA